VREQPVLGKLQFRAECHGWLARRFCACIHRSCGIGFPARDPLTAHGITDALRDAELLARAALAGTTDAFAHFEQTRHDLSTRLLEVTDDIAAFRWTEEQLQTLHRQFSSEMSREQRVIAQLEASPCPSPSANALPAV
jgi:2-polyprenyl-6-methoxyphenol hydroxylase-like FAD-dependent oxidoreductase